MCLAKANRITFNCRPGIRAGCSVLCTGYAKLNLIIHAHLVWVYVQGVGSWVLGGTWIGGITKVSFSPFADVPRAQHAHIHTHTKKNNMFGFHDIVVAGAQVTSGNNLMLSFARENANELCVLVPCMLAPCGGICVLNNSYEKHCDTWAESRGIHVNYVSDVWQCTYMAACIVVESGLNKSRTLVYSTIGQSSPAQPGFPAPVHRHTCTYLMISIARHRCRGRRRRCTSTATAAATGEIIDANLRAYCTYFTHECDAV